MQSKDLYKIAQIMFAMEKKTRKPDVSEGLKNERYQRTMSDEYPWVKPARPRESIPADIRALWENLARRWRE